jgi:hypothetical protein
MILSSVCLSIDMSFDFNPPHALNKCDTLPMMKANLWMMMKTMKSRRK